MCAGGVIHSIGDSQDIRFIGGLSVYIPFTSSSLMVSNFALCGMPFLAGFYSQGFINRSTIQRNNISISNFERYHPRCVYKSNR
jgi:NADH-ubiquinone oxidoreductase chain 5